MDKHFVEQRANAANADAELELLWYKKMEAIFKEIDSISHCIPPDGAFTFLDLGLEYIFPSSPPTLIRCTAVAQVDLPLMYSNAIPRLWVMASRSVSHRAGIGACWTTT